MSVRTALFLVLGTAFVSAGCVTSSGLRPSADSPVVRKPETYAAFGDFKAKSGFAKEYTPEQQEEMRRDARASYAKALEVDPKCMHAWIGLARLEKACGDMVAAGAAYQKALALEARNAALWAELGHCQLKQKLWDAAIASVGKAAELEPRNGQYATMLGYTLVLSGRKAEAVAALAKVHGEAKACIEIARALHHMQSPEDCAALLARAAEIDPSSPALHKARADLGSAPKAEMPAPVGMPARIDVRGGSGQAPPPSSVLSIRTRPE